MTGINLQDIYVGEPRECFEGLTFGELAIGEKYISIPVPGDNNGHGGFRNAHYIFEKVNPSRGSPNETPNNALRLTDRVLCQAPDLMPVLRVE